MDILAKIPQAEYSLIKFVGFDKETEQTITLSAHISCDKCIRSPCEHIAELIEKLSIKS